jgi:hypothetical protein
MNENEFASKLKPWLDRSAAATGEMQATRLRAARLRAMDAYREPVRLFGRVTVGAGVLQKARQPAFLAAPVVVVLLAMLALQPADEPDLGELDAQLLTQELPPDAFLDQDFRSWLVKSEG